MKRDNKNEILPIKTVIEVLSNDGFYKYVNEIDIDKIYAETMKTQEIFIYMNLNWRDTEFYAIDPCPDVTKRAYSVDFRRLYEAVPAFVMNELLIIMKKLSLALKVDRIDEVVDELSKLQKSCTGYSRWDIYNTYAHMLAIIVNKNILYASLDKIYLRGSGNEGYFIFITDKMYSIIKPLDNYGLRTP